MTTVENSAIAATEASDSALATNASSAAEGSRRRGGLKSDAEVLSPPFIGPVFRAALAVVTGFQLVYIIESYHYLDPHRAKIALIFSLFGIAVTTCSIGLSFLPALVRNWKSFSLCLSLLLVANVTCMSVVTRETAPLFLAALLMMAGTSGLLPWEMRWQGPVTLACVAAAAMNTALVPQSDPYAGYRWLAIVTMAATASLTNFLWNRWRTALRKSQKRLRAELEQRDRIIAKREEAEKRLRESEAKLRKVFDASPDMICIASMIDGRVIDINQAFTTTGFTREQALRWRPGKESLFADRKQPDELWQTLLAQRQVRNREVGLKTRDGAVVPCLLSAVTVEINGEPCALLFSRDITELKHTERELIATREAALAASRAKSEFLSSMSHEIRTPMNAILGMADLLAETLLSSEQRRYVDTMTVNGNSLLDLINSILDLAKVESGRLSLDNADFDLNELVERVVDTLGIRAHEKHLELGVRILPDVPENLVGDPLRLRQVLINLIGNAIKFTEQGEVVLTVEKDPEANEPGCLRFSVRDTGIGISPEKLESVFQSFTQADSSTTRKYGGSGLGLAIATRLAELMGGRIWAESKPGQGSRFHFTARLGVQAAPAAQEPGAPLKLEGLPVLVVDDNATNRLILREILARRAAEVTEADSSANALAEWQRAKAAGRPYQLVLLDCRMPEMDGFEVAQRLRSQSAGVDPIILMLTSDDLHPKLARLRELGLDAYVVKPVKRSELLRAIAAAMGKTTVMEEKVAPAAAAVAAASHETIRILLAEDSPDNRLLVQAYLRNSPYELEMAENGQVAVEKFISGSYDLVLMDVHMPVMDGYTAVRKMREWERGQNRQPTPIVALTASALEEGVRESLEVGCTAHLSKPIKKSTLLEALHQFVSAPASANGAPDAAKIVVEADTDLKELIPNFLARKRDDLGTIAAALERRDYSALSAFGHRIKGEGGGFGFDAISEIGAGIEQAARARDARAASRHVQALANYLDRVQVVFRNRTAAGDA